MWKRQVQISGTKAKTSRMTCLTLTTLLALLPLALGLPTARQTEDCEDVHIFLARGTGEDYPGRQISNVYAICNGTGDASCGYEDIQYPATLIAPECKSCSSFFTRPPRGRDH